MIRYYKWVCPKLEEKKQQFWAPENTNMMIHREKFEAASPNSVPPRRRWKRFLERKTCFTWTAGNWRSMEVNGNVIIQTSTFSLQHQMHNSPQIWPLMWRLQPLWAPQKLRLRTCDVASHGSVRCCGIWTFVHQFFWIMGCQVWLEQVRTCWNMLEHGVPLIPFVSLEAKVLPVCSCKLWP